MFWKLLNTGGISLERLQSFCLVARARGVTRAANGDSTTQSLYSRQIKELEAFFGVELLRRQGRGIILTPEGQTLYRLALDHLTTLTDFKSACQNQPTRLIVAAGESVLHWLIIPRLQRITAALPTVTFRFLNLPTAELASRLSEGSVDLALIRPDTSNSVLKLIPLGKLSHALFVPKSLIKNPHPGKRNYILDGLPLATLEGSGTFRQQLVTAFDKAGLRLNIRHEFPSFPLVARSLEAINCAAILPSLAGPDLREAGVLEFKPDLLGAFDRPISLAWNTRIASIRPVLRSVRLILAKELKF